MGMDWLVGAAFTGILNNLWIAAAIAATAWALGRFLPRTNAATRHLLWWTVLACVLLLPWVSLSRPPESDIAVEAVAAPSDIPALVAGPTPQTPTPARSTFPLQIPEGAWARAAFLLWFAFALVQAARMAWSFLYLFRMKRKSHPADPDLVKRFLDAYNKGTAWFDDPANREAAIKIQMATSRIKLDDVEKAYTFLHDKKLFEPSGEVSKESVNSVIDALRGLGDIGADFKVDRVILPGVTQVSN